MKLIDENVICTESLQDYMQDNTEFLIVGIVGPQSAGKSTVLNLLIHNEITEDIKKSLFKSTKCTDENESDTESIKLLTNKLSNIDIKKSESAKKLKVFKVENSDDLENSSHRTQGIDIFVTHNRVGSTFSRLLTGHIFFIKRDVSVNSSRLSAIYIFVSVRRTHKVWK